MPAERKPDTAAEVSLADGTITMNNVSLYRGGKAYVNNLISNLIDTDIYYRRSNRFTDQPIYVSDFRDSEAEQESEGENDGSGRSGVHEGTLCYNNRI